MTRLLPVRPLEKSARLLIFQQTQQNRGEILDQPEAFDKSTTPKAYNGNVHSRFLLTYVSYFQPYNVTKVSLQIHNLSEYDAIEYRSTVGCCMEIPIYFIGSAETYCWLKQLTTPYQSSTRFVWLHNQSPHSLAVIISDNQYIEATGTNPIILLSDEQTQIFHRWRFYSVLPPSQLNGTWLIQTIVNAWIQAVSQHISCLLNQNTTIFDALTPVGELIQQHYRCAGVMLTLFDATGNWGIVYSLSSQSSANLEDRPHVRIAIEESVVMQQLRAGIPYLQGDLTDSNSLWEQYMATVGLRSLVAIPLLNQERCIGTLNLTWHKTNGCDAAFVPLLMQIGTMLSETVQRSDVHIEMEQSLQRANALYNTTNALILSDDLDRMLEIIVVNNHVALNCVSSQLVLFDHEREMVTNMYSVGEYIDESLVSPTYDVLMQGAIGEVIATQSTLVVSDLVENGKLANDSAETYTNEQIGSLIIAPITNNTEPLGIFCAFRGKKQPHFTESDVDLTIALSNHAAVALKNVSLKEEMQRRTEALAILAQLSTALRMVRDVMATAQIVLHHNLTFVEATNGVLYLEEQDSAELQIYAAQHTPLPTHIPYLVRQAFSSGQIVPVTDVTSDPRLSSASDLPATTNSVLLIPLQAIESAIGVLQLNFAERTLWSSNTLKLLEAMADVAGSALQRTMFTATLERMVTERSRELKAKNQELLEKNEQLTELDKLKNKFISDMSHELRTPVTGLSLHLELMEKRPERAPIYLQMVKGEVGRLKELVLDILKLSRFDLNRVQVAFHDLDFNQLVQYEIALYQQQAEAIGLEMRIVTNPTLPLLWGESVQLAEMVNQLLDNALRYTSSGFIEVTTAYNLGADEIVLTVQDSGLGIAQEEQQQIFGRFYRGTNSHPVHGTGLGLNLVYEIVKMHGGAIEVQSEEGVGSTFRVCLPRTKERQASKHQNSEPMIVSRQIAKSTINR